MPYDRSELAPTDAGGSHMRRIATSGWVLAACLAGAFAVPATGWAATPQPVSAYPMADPGGYLDGNRFLMFRTGSGLGEATAPEASGPWTAPVDRLAALPPWTTDSNIWAPDIIPVTNGWVVYFSAVLHQNSGSPRYAAGARCIGTATSASPTGPFVASPTPLVCLPGYGAGDDMSADPGNRVTDQGAIDASPAYVTISGEKRLFLVYRTQGLPATIRMVRLSVTDGQTVVGDSHQLVYSVMGNGSGYTFDDTIEGPSLVQHGDYFVLFVARGNYGQCSYSTAWYKSQHLWSWTNDSETSLLTSGNTGLCGPGGADVTDSEVGPSQNRIFLHGWVCGTTPCSGQPNATAVRDMYAAVLTWGSDGYTPIVGSFLGPA
jgi:hypothetical protein